MEEQYGERGSIEREYEVGIGKMGGREAISKKCMVGGREGGHREASEKSMK